MAVVECVPNEGFWQYFRFVRVGRVNETRDGGDVKVTHFRVRGTLALLIAIAKLQRIIVFDARGCCRDSMLIPCFSCFHCRSEGPDL